MLVFVFEGEQSDPDQMHVLGREDTEKPSIEKLHSQVNKESLFSRDSLIYTRISFSRKNKHIYFFLALSLIIVCPYFGQYCNRKLK